MTAYPAGDSAFGVSQLAGNGWEWTSTPFGPFDGFQAFDFYPGYSANFFDNAHYRDQRRLVPHRRLFPAPLVPQLVPPQLPLCLRWLPPRRKLRPPSPREVREGLTKPGQKELPSALPLRRPGVGAVRGHHSASGVRSDARGQPAYCGSTRRRSWTGFRARCWWRNLAAAPAKRPATCWPPCRLGSRSARYYPIDVSRRPWPNASGS